MGWTNTRQNAIHHPAPNPLPVKNGNSHHCSYPFELRYFTLLWRLLCEHKSQGPYFSYWPVSQRTEARHHALPCNPSLQLPVCIDGCALLVAATPARDMPKSPANEDLALAVSTSWLSPEAPELLSWMLPKWPDAEPRLGFPIGTGKLLAVPLWPPVLLF